MARPIKPKQAKKALHFHAMTIVFLTGLLTFGGLSLLYQDELPNHKVQADEVNEPESDPVENEPDVQPEPIEEEASEEVVSNESEQGQLEKVVELVESDDADLVVEEVEVGTDIEGSISTEIEQGIDGEITENSEVDLTEAGEGDLTEPSERAEGAIEGEDIIENEVLEMNQVEEVTLNSTEAEEGATTDVEVVEEEVESTLELPEAVSEIAAEKIADLDEESNILAGKILTQTDVKDEIVEQGTIKIADVDLAGYSDGQPVEIQEAITAMIGLTTTEKDIEKAVLESSLESENTGLIKGILEDQATEKALIESADRGIFESLESKIEVTMVDDDFQEKLASDLEDDPDVEIILENLITQEEKEKIVKNVVNLSLQGDELSREEILRQAISDANQGGELKGVLTEKLTEDSVAQNTLMEAIAQEQASVEVKSAKELIRVTASSPDGDIEIPLENLNFKAGSLIMTIDPVGEFTPGLHQVEIEINNPISGETERYTQDFTWGVLAVNTDQDGYKAGDQVMMHIGVLDDRGMPVCDADVQIEIINSTGASEFITVENTGNCTIFDSTNIEPDYQAFYASKQDGLHEARVTATLSDDKTRTSVTNFTIGDELSYCVERQAATRLYPVGESPMSFTIYFPDDFEGHITDQVPASFGVYDTGQTGDASSSLGEVALSEDGRVKTITWDVVAEAGHMHEFKYTYDAPDISPEFYTLGPLRLHSSDLSTSDEEVTLEILTYQESRQWQIANDEPTIGADGDELLGNWQFNTGSGSTAVDESSYTNDGTLTNMESGDWSASAPGFTNGNPFALDFDGSNEFVTIADPAGGELDFGASDDFTITGWFNRDTTSNQDTIIAKRDSLGSGDPGYLVYVDNSSGQLIFEVADGDGDEYSLSSSRSFFGSYWSHFAIVWDDDSDTGTEIYIDGFSDFAFDTGIIAEIDDLSNALDLRLASESDGGEPFDGKLDDLRLYNRVLTDSEIQILYSQNKPAGLNSNLALWLLAEEGVTTSGSDVTDWLDHAAGAYTFSQGTTANQPELVADAVNGHSVIRFDGTNDALTSNFVVEPQSIFSVIKNTDTGSNERTFFGMESDAAGSADGVYMKANNNSGNAEASYLLGSSLTSASSTSLDNEFYLHTGSINTSTAQVSLEINGGDLATDSGGGRAVTLTESAVGAGYVSDTLSGYFQGDVAEILAFSDEKTGTDRQKIESYLALKYGITLDQSSVPGGVDYLNSNASAIWTQDYGDVYENDIAGIGRDDISGLAQNTSQSINSDAILQVSEAMGQADLEFLMWANNDGAATWTATGAPTDYELLSRQWSMQEFGDVGTVDLEFDVEDSDFNVPDLQGGTSYYLIYDSDSDTDLSDETPLAMTDNGAGGDDTSLDDQWTAQLNFPFGGAGGGTLFTIATRVDPPPTVTDGNISINTGSGTSNAFIVSDEIIVTWDNSATGDNNSGLTAITADLSGWGGSLMTGMTDTTACGGTASDDIYEACYTVVSGAIDTLVSTSVSASNLGGQTTTADSTVATVDNQAPTLTTANISVIGASGISGEFINGDTATGTWNNAVTGDNNADTISAVEFDLSEFLSADTAVSGSEVGNVWTADITGSLDAQADANNNVVVTVIDNAGNETTLEGTNDYTVDTILPSITSVTSVAGDTTATYYDTTDDSSTAIAFISDDTGAGVDACRWDTVDSNYALLSFACSSTSNCTTDLDGDGAKTVYIRCADGAGNAMNSSQQVDYIVDSIGPSGTSITPNSTRIINNDFPTFVVNDGADSASGIDTSTRILQRREGTYSSNSCGSFGGYSTIAYSGTYPNISDETATAPRCYQYQWVVSDNAGNQSTSSATTTIVRVPLTTLIITGGNNQNYGDPENPIGHTLGTPLQVQVTDGGTNTALEDEVTVDFSIISTPGSPTANGQGLSAASDNTSATGHAQVNLTLGDRAGDYQVQASSSDAAVSNSVTFTGTANDYFDLVVIETDLAMTLDPINNALDFRSPTVSVTTNAASYDIQLSPNQWPTSGTLTILNWLSNLGFGWNLNGEIQTRQRSTIVAEPVVLEPQQLTWIFMVPLILLMGPEFTRTVLNLEELILAIDPYHLKRILYHPSSQIK